MLRNDASDALFAGDEGARVDDVDGRARDERLADDCDTPGRRLATRCAVLEGSAVICIGGRVIGLGPFGSPCDTVYGNESKNAVSLHKTARV